MSGHARRVLIVEDEFLIADDLSRLLERSGFAVVRPVASSRDALQALEEGGIDFVVLDINLDGVLSFDLAERLQEAGIPFVFLTGYECHTLPAQFANVPFMQKPHEPSEVLAEIRLHLDGPHAHQVMPITPQGRKRSAI